MVNVERLSTIVSHAPGVGVIFIRPGFCLLLTHNALISLDNRLGYSVQLHRLSETQSDPHDTLGQSPLFRPGGLLGTRSTQLEPLW